MRDWASFLAMEEKNCKLKTQAIGTDLWNMLTSYTESQVKFPTASSGTSQTHYKYTSTALTQFCLLQDQSWLKSLLDHYYNCVAFKQTIVLKQLSSQDICSNTSPVIA